MRSTAEWVVVSLLGEPVAWVDRTTPLRPQEEAANAKVLGAALDLLDACRQLISSVDKFDGTECVNAILSARSAIAKAEGREAA